MATHRDGGGVPEPAEVLHAAIRFCSGKASHGVPQADMCELVRDGLDRDHAAAAAEDFKYAPSGAQMAGLRANGERWEAEREAALSAAALNRLLRNVTSRLWSYQR
jgi:hypothetical protein